MLYEAENTSVQASPIVSRAFVICYTQRHFFSCKGTGRYTVTY